ncbi:MAG: sensor histidine kinase [Candidatus Pristimantibacillus sp.]
MTSFLDKFKLNGLFGQMFIVMVVSIIAVAVLTSWVSIRMSEQLFINTFSITNSKVINQIKANFESFNYSVVTASNNMLQSGTIKGFLMKEDSDSVTMTKQVFNISQQMKRIKSNVDAYETSITITGYNGRSYTTDSSYWPIDTNSLRNHEITNRTIAEPKRLMYQLYKESPTGSSTDEPVIIASKALLERTSGNLYGALYIAIRENQFKRLYTNFTSKGNDVVVVDQSGLVVSSNLTDMIGTDGSELLGYAVDMEEHHSDYIDVRVMGKEYILLAEYLPTYDFYLVNLIDKELALSQMMDMKAVVLISAVIVLGALLIVFLISRRMTRSLTLLVRQMSRVTKKNFDNYITVSGSSEVKQLGQAYNYMLDELNDYIKQLVQTQKDQRNAELAALQMQINPHFLYNTLASIKILVQQGSKEKAAETINALISLLQNTVSNVSETITVEQELTNLKNYVFINHVRYGEQIKVQYFIAPNCLNEHVPKLIIQPFIENAFFHAFNEKGEGSIYVLVSQEMNVLICEVVDNGIGIAGLTNGDTLPNPKEGTSQLFSGIGVRNVHERIKLLYGEEYGVTILSNLGEGTKVKIRLPLIHRRK